MHHPRYENAVSGLCGNDVGIHWPSASNPGKNPWA